MKIVFFDGYCTLCNSAIDWLMQHDPKKILKFASLQGEHAKKLGLASADTDPDTIIYHREGKTFERSEAVLKIAKDLGGIYAVLATIGTIIPTPLRDKVYRFIAKNRYRWFPRRETCRIPTKEEKEYFL